MKRKKIKIPAPLAKYGDIVLVHNYRRKKKNPRTNEMEDANKWELGTVCSLKYVHIFDKKFYWKYEVRIDRGVKKNGALSIVFLNVDDDGILKKSG